ncbi:MAG TPA: hypothetical protein VH083_00975 [Myxococcales bacterium]|jgi:hypothetical protein|nr:hypothetical protein [Myxococcales bacterium]
MEIDRWPIVARAQLIQAFRPGEPSSKEAPFRTLRAHGWATAGVRVATRKSHRASGQFTVFSSLNVDAGQSARQGHARAATAWAKAAARIEKTKAFGELRDLLSGRSIDQVAAIVDGNVAKAPWPELLAVLRLVARETMLARSKRPLPEEGAAVVMGRIADAQPDFLVLEAKDGARTAVPRWLAQSAHRENVGDCLALVTDRLGDRQMVVNAIPGIDIDAQASPKKFSPFDRSAVHLLTLEDVRLLSRPPQPLKITIPVIIET